MTAVMSPPPSCVTPMWRGCSICGQALHDDEADHCAEHRDTHDVALTVRIGRGSIWWTMRTIPGNTIADMVTYAGHLQADEAIRGARRWVTDMALGPDEATTYVDDVAERAAKRAAEDVTATLHRYDRCADAHRAAWERQARAAAKS